MHTPCKIQLVMSVIMNALLQPKSCHPAQTPAAFTTPPPFPALTPALTPPPPPFIAPFLPASPPLAITLTSENFTITLLCIRDFCFVALYAKGRPEMPSALVESGTSAQAVSYQQHHCLMAIALLHQPHIPVTELSSHQAPHVQLAGLPSLGSLM